MLSPVKQITLLYAPREKAVAYLSTPLFLFSSARAILLYALDSVNENMHEK
jgi:hypothetical protein